MKSSWSEQLNTTHWIAIALARSWEEKGRGKEREGEEGGGKERRREGREGGREGKGRRGRKEGEGGGKVKRETER